MMMLLWCSFCSQPLVLDPTTYMGLYNVDAIAAVVQFLLFVINVQHAVKSKYFRSEFLIVIRAERNKERWRIFNRLLALNVVCQERLLHLLSIDFYFF